MNLFNDAMLLVWLDLGTSWLKLDWIKLAASVRLQDLCRYGYNNKHLVKVRERWEPCLKWTQHWITSSFAPALQLLVGNWNTNAYPFGWHTVVLLAEDSRVFVAVLYNLNGYKT